ncbi:hypothetical protein DdX_17977 [Ditylenchus destructor]|uniref:Uncharacterized protein n=1 Tax=Ditylenchus destructor TaxID=166010 RepID=A0AAD4QT36_9BILA|nr:hypothetical protein DdX_17977 [Ditylenchus destructor]
MQNTSFYRVWGNGAIAVQYKAFQHTDREADKQSVFIIVSEGCSAEGITILRHRSHFGYIPLHVLYFDAPLPLLKLELNPLCSEQSAEYSMWQNQNSKTGAGKSAGHSDSQRPSCSTTGDSGTNQGQTSIACSCKDKDHDFRQGGCCSQSPQKKLAKCNAELMACRKERDSLAKSNKAFKEKLRIAKESSSVGSQFYSTISLARVRPGPNQRCIPRSGSSDRPNVEPGLRSGPAPSKNIQYLRQKRQGDEENRKMSSRGNIKDRYL